MFSERGKGVCAFLLLLLAACCTYFPGYHTPAAFFWDENFHIPSAQRYLNGVFFMEPHPPLGKLLIAGGEWLLDANPDDTVFISEEYAKDPPAGFSFAGYRLLPVVCGALLGPLLYLLILSISGSLPLALFSGMLPIFDNALIVHSRGAMLDSPLLLSIVAAILSYYLSLTNSTHKNLWLILFSVFCGTAITTKVNGVILLLFAAHLAVHNRKSIRALILITFPAIITFISVWWVHYYVAFTVDPKLPDHGLFEVSESFAKKVLSGEARKITSLFGWVQEATEFGKRYQEGVPPLDFCKDDENGSPPLLWPLGGRTINYRWESIGELTRYLYLVPNPITWLIGLLGVLLSFVYTCFSLLSRKARTSTTDTKLSALLLSAYLLSWLAPYVIPRVFYLYHYFIPLLLSWMLFGVVVRHFMSFGVKISLLLSALTTTCGFLWYSPFTYYLPITRSELESRALFPIWDLRFQNTPSYYLTQCGEQGTGQRRRSEEWHLTIGTLEANYIEQGVGEPEQNQDGFQTSTNSRIQFPLNAQYVALKGEVSITSITRASSGVVEIKLDGVTVQKDALSFAVQGNIVRFELNLQDARVLTLESRNTSPDSDPILLRWRNLELTRK